MRKILIFLLAALCCAQLAPAQPNPSRYAGGSSRWFILYSAARCRGLGVRSQTDTTQMLATANRVDTLAYLQSVTQPYYGTTLTRIGGTTKASFTGPSAAGTQLTQASGSWGFDNRHGYSKRQVWNADESLLMIENPSTTYDSTGNSGKSNGNSGPSLVILNASDYSVTNYYQCTTATKSRDERWLRMNPYWVVSLIQATDGGSAGGDSASTTGDTLAVMDIRTCQRVSTITPDVKALYIGAGEGTMAVDSLGNEYVALHNSRYNNNPSAAQQVQLFKIAAGTGTLSKGTAYTAPRCSLYMDFNTGVASKDSMEDCDIGHVQLSATGKYLIIHYSDNAFGGGSASTSASATTGIGADQYRVFDVNLSTLAVTGLHPYKSTVEPCDIRQKGGITAWVNSAGTWWSNGWGRGLNHPDVARNPYTGHDVVIGGRRCGNYGGAGRGRVELFDLANGNMLFLSDSSSEAPVHHVSARNYLNPGYVVVTHQLQNSHNARDNELVVYSLNGGAALRVAQTHTQAAGTKYRGEAHPSASPTLSRVVFASSWRVSCSVCSALSDATAKMLPWKDYVVDLSNVCLP